MLHARESMQERRPTARQTGVNRNVEGRSVRRVLGYNGNGVHFRQKAADVATNGYQEFRFG